MLERNRLAHGPLVRPALLLISMGLLSFPAVPTAVQLWDRNAHGQPDALLGLALVAACWTLSGVGLGYLLLRADAATRNAGCATALIVVVLAAVALLVLVGG